MRPALARLCGSPPLRSLAPKVDFDGYQAEEVPVEVQAEEDVEGMLMAEDEGAAAGQEAAPAG